MNFNQGEAEVTFSSAETHTFFPPVIICRGFSIISASSTGDLQKNGTRDFRELK